MLSNEGKDGIPLGFIYKVGLETLQQSDCEYPALRVLSFYGQERRELLSGRSPLDELNL